MIGYVVEELANKVQPLYGNQRRPGLPVRIPQNFLRVYVHTGKRDARPSQETSDSLGHLQAELLPNEDVCRGDWGPELENPSVFWGLQVS